MVYHTDSPANPTERNAILDLSLAKSYLKDLNSFPLQLDVALPLFSWGRQFDRQGHLIRLFKEISVQDLHKNLQFKPRSINQFEATEDSMLHSKRVMKGDLIIVDQNHIEQVNEIACFIQKRISVRSVLFYHLDAELTQFTTQEKRLQLNEVYDVF